MANMESFADRLRRQMQENAKKEKTGPSAQTDRTIQRSGPASARSSSSRTRQSSRRKPEEQKPVTVGMDRIREEDEREAALTREQNKAINQDKQRWDTTGGRPNSEPGTLDDFGAWVGLASQADRNAMSSVEIDQVLRDLDDVRAALRQSPLSNEPRKAKVPKLTSTLGETPAFVPNGQKEQSDLGFAAKLVDDLEQQLVKRRGELAAQEANIAKYGSKAGYEEAQRLKQVDVKELARQVADAQAESGVYDELLRENQGIEQQLGFTYNDIMADPALYEYIQNDPSKKSGFDALEANLARMTASESALSGYGVQAAEHGDMTAIKDQVFEQEQTLKKAKTLQYEDTPTTMSDFRAHAAAGMALENPSFDEVYNWGGAVVGRPLDEERISNKATFARGNADRIRMTLDDNDPLKLMTWMSDEEESIYGARLNEGGMEAADDYIKTLIPTLKQRFGEQIASGLNSKVVYEERPFEGGAGFVPTREPGNVPMQYIFGGLDIIRQRTPGLRHLAGEGILDENAYDTAASLIRQDMPNVGPVIPDNVPFVGGRSVGEVGYDLFTNAAGMIPSILSNFFVPGSGAFVIGVSSAENAYKEGIKSYGMTQSQAQRFGLFSGASEAFLEKALGMAQTGGGSLAKMLGAKTDNLVTNALGRALLDIGGNALSEGSEEYLQSVAEDVFVKLAMDESIPWDDFDWSSEDALYEAFMGAVTGGFFESTTQISTAIDKTNIGNAINAGGADITVEGLINQGLGAGRETQARNLAERAQGRLDAGERLSNFAAGDLFYAAAGAEANPAMDQAIELARGQARAEEQTTPMADAVTPEDIDTAFENDVDTQGSQKDILRGIVSKAANGLALTIDEAGAALENSTARQMLSEVFGETITQAVDAAQVQAMSERIAQAEGENVGRSAARGLALEMAQNRPGATQTAQGKIEGNASGEADAALGAVVEAQIEPVVQPGRDRARELAMEVAREQEQAAASARSEKSEPVIQPARDKARALAMEMAQEQTATKAAPANPTSENDAIALDSGNQVTVTGIADVADGTATIKTADGQQLPLDMVRFASPRTRALYEHAAKMVSPETARAYVSSYDGGSPVEYFRKAWDVVYGSAMAGMSLDQIENGIKGRGGLGMLGQFLTETAKQKAVIRGELDARAAQEAMRQEAVDAEAPAAPADADATPSKPGLTRTYDAGLKLTKQQDAELRLLDAMGKKYGVPIVAVDQVAEGAANGSYNPETGVIEVAIDSVEQAYLYVATHELAHYVQDWNPDEYGMLKDFVLDKLSGEKDYDLDARIEQISKGRNGMTREQAIDEIIADAIPAILSDEANVRELIGTNRTLGEKIRDFVGEFINEIKRVVSRLGKLKGRYEIDALSRNADALTGIYDMFTAALEGASETARAGGAALSDTQTQYLIKSRSLIEAEDTDANTQSVAEMKPVAALKGDEFAKGEKNLVDQVSEFFASLGNSVENPVLGDVDIDRRGIKDSIAHGVGRIKAMAFKAVPDIIANGKIIDFQADWKGRGYDTVVIAAPMTIGEGRYTGDYYAAAIIERKANTQGFYLHELVTGKRTVTPIKTSSVGTEVPSASDAHHPSILSLLEKVRDVKNKKYSMKSAVDGVEVDGQGNIRINEPDAITTALWGKISTAVKRLGYDIRGAEDAKTLFTRGYFLKKDQSEAIKRVLGMQTGNAEADTAYEAATVATKAAKKFGTTLNFKLAGYLTVNGSLLDFSDGQRYRVQDHREISNVLDLPSDAGYSDGLIKFMNMGNIRLQSYGIDISMQPNAKQKPVLRRFFDSLNGEVTVDFSALNGNNIGSVDYPEGTRTTRILGDIDKFFETGAGEVPVVRDIERLRYSMKDLGDADINERLDADPDVAASIDLLSTLAEKSHDIVSGLKPEAIARAAAETAGKILKTYQSKFDRQTLVDDLTALYTGVVGTIDWRDTVKLASDLGTAVVGQSKHVDNYLHEHYADVRDKLRSTGITLTETQMAEVESAYGSYNTFRKANFGRLNLKKEGGIGLDSLWMELSEQNPELFDSAVSEGDQPIALAEALDALKPTYRNLYGMDEGSAALDAGMNMLVDFFDTAIQGKGKIEAEKARFAAKQKIAEMRAQYKQSFEARIKEVQRENIRKRQELGAKYREAASAELRQKLTQQYRKLTDRRNAALDRQKAYYQTMNKTERARRAESRDVTKYRTNIEGTVRKLQTWLAKPTDVHHVPQFLRDTVANALGSIDMHARGGRDTLKGARWADSMRVLLDEVRAIDGAMNGEGGGEAARYEGLYMTIDPDLLPTLKEFVADITARGSVRLADLKAAQLKNLDAITRGITHAVTTVGKTWSNARYQTMAELGGETIVDLDAQKPRKSHGKVLDMLGNFLSVDQLDSFSFFKRLGGAAQTVLDELYAGWQKSVTRIREASDATDKLLGDLHVKKDALRKWRSDAKSYKLDNGASVSLTTAQVIDLFNLMKRPQALRHILNGGIVAANIEGKGGKTIRQPIAHVTESDVARITGTLTEAQKQLADGMRAFLSREAAAWGNETSMELYLYEKFTESDYWPIRSNKDFLKTKSDEQATAFNAIRNMGFTKALVERAGNPITVGDAFQVYSDHITQMATYNGLAAPMDDAMKWYNYTQRTESEDGTRTIDTSVKERLRIAQGDAGRKYMENLLKDINGMSSGSYGTEIGDTLLGKFKANAIAGSVRVVVQQPTAILRASAMINPGYLATSVTGNRSRNLREMQRWAPIAWWKAQGNFEMGVGQSMRQIIVGDDSRVARMQNKMMALAGWADDMTWAHLWGAVKQEVKVANRGIDVTSDAFYQKVAARFTDIVNQTQVVDSVFHRSQIMRSKDRLNKMATAFMAEPTKTYNLLSNGVWEISRGGARAKTRMVRTVVAWTASVVLNAAVKALWDAWRKRGEDDEYWDLFEEYWKQSFSEDMNPLNMLPWGRDIMSLFQGFDVERADMSLISDMMKSATEAYTHFFGEGTTKSDYAVMTDMIKKASGFTSLPLNGLLTSVEGLINGFQPGTILWTKKGAKDAYKKLYEYIVAGEAEKAVDLRERVQQQTAEKEGVAYNKMGYTLKSDKEIDAGIAKELAGSDPRIPEAWEARGKADAKTVARIKSELTKEGFSGEVIDKALDEYAKMVEEKEPKEKDLAEPLDTRLYTKEHLWTAIENTVNGKSAADIETIARELMDDSDAKNPETTIKNYVTERFKPQYIDMYYAGQTGKMERLEKVLREQFGYTSDQLDDWIESDIKVDMWDAIDQGDGATAKQYAGRLLSDGFADNDSLRNSLNSKYINIYKDLYFSGQLEEAAVLIEAMRALGLTGSGGNAWNENWLNKNWRSKKSRQKWEAEQEKKAG